MYNIHHMCTLANMYNIHHMCTLANMYNIHHMCTLANMYNIYHMSTLANMYTTRNLVIPRCRLSTYGTRAFTVAGPVCWNSLSDYLKSS